MADKFNILTIQKYLDGKLDPKQMHELERQALDDPFLADALEGYAFTKKPVEHQLSILQRQLEERIATQQDNKNNFNFTWHRLSIAAAAGLMFTTVAILFTLDTENTDSKITSTSNRVNTELNAQKERAESGPVLKPALKNADGSFESAPQVAARTPRAGSAGTLHQAPTAVTQIPAANTAPVSAPPALPQESVVGRGVENHLSGRVLGVRGEPLPGVSVRLKGTNIATQTDSKGEFMLPDTIRGTLNLMYLGYEPKELNVNRGERLAAIVLQPAGDSLNEVVVIASGVARSSAARMSTTPVGAQPVGGWEAFQEYLQKNLRYPNLEARVSGDVIVSFGVDSRNRPANIQVEKSLHALCDAEAKRLIEQGPDWKLTDPGRVSRIQVTVNFRP